MKRNEVWLVNLDPTVGAELKKSRPVVIVNDDSVGILPLRVIVPLTDWKAHYDKAAWMVKLEPNSSNNLSKASAADCFQIRSVSQKRFVKKIGEVNISDMIEIEKAIAIILKL